MSEKWFKIKKQKYKNRIEEKWSQEVANIKKGRSDHKDPLMVCAPRFLGGVVLVLDQF